MPQVNIYEAKTHLSKLVEQAESGQDIILARGGRPVAKLTGISTGKRTIRFGVLKGKVHIADDFDAPLPDNILADFEGR